MAAGVGGTIRPGKRSKLGWLDVVRLVRLRKTYVKLYLARARHQVSCCFRRLNVFVPLLFVWLLCRRALRWMDRSRLERLLSLWKSWLLPFTGIESNCVWIVHECLVQSP